MNSKPNSMNSKNAKGTARNADEEKKAKASARRFTRIVAALRSFASLFQVDRAEHVAKGFVPCEDGKAHRTSLAYDDQTSLIALTVHLGRVPEMTASQAECLMRAQSKAKIARLDRDPEDGELVLRGGCVCPQASNPATVLDHLIADLRRVLADDRLIGLMGQ